MTSDITRRNFFAGLAALGSASGLRDNSASAIAATAPKAAALTIRDVQMLHLTGKGKQKALYLKLLADQGAEGLYGPIDEEAGAFVDRFFRQRLIGRDGLAGEAFWDQMFRIDRHSRGSHYLMGLSAVDNALWDLRGRWFGLPVYRLLGGSRRTLNA